MNKKGLIIIIVIFLLIIGLWISGIIPKQIARIYGTKYMKDKFPEMQLEFVDINWNKYYGDYIITFRDNDNQIYSCVIGPKIFPIRIGQGILVIEEAYSEKYCKPILISQKIAVATFIINHNESQNSISTQDIKINEKLLNTYREIINSQAVKNKVKEIYPNVKNIELESVQNTGVLRAIYVCEDYNENECIEITNKYVEVFSETIVDTYNINNIYVLDSANISTRLVEK